MTWVIHPTTPKTSPELHVYHSTTRKPGKSRKSRVSGGHGVAAVGFQVSQVEQTRDVRHQILLNIWNSHTLKKPVA